MAHPPARFLGSRVGTRLFALFVLAALLPLALSDWLAATAVTDLARTLQASTQARATRQVGLQVFDRLSNAKSMLVALAEVSVTTDGEWSTRLPAASGRMFSKLIHLDPTGSPDWPEGSGDALLQDWKVADPGTVGMAPLPLKTGSMQAFLRISESGAATAPRLLMAVTTAGQMTWLGELRPEHVWEPVETAAIDSGWRVLDSRGRSLVTHGDADLLPSATVDVRPDENDVQRARTGLFLGAEFGAGAWEFIEQRAMAKVQWRGVSLVAWLGLVALGTVLLIALASQRAIRRVLVPLEQLTRGTRELTAGDSTARVAITSDDEFGSLGSAFNEMAARIEGQFNSLEALSAVDRDVLAGIPIEQIAARVLDELRRLHPSNAFVIAWLSLDDPNHMLHLVGRPDQPTSIRPAEFTIDNTASSSFTAFTTDRMMDEAALEQGMPWCAGLLGPAARQVAVLPLRGGQSTPAVLVIGAEVSLEKAELKSATELRDRLAVAFSARERERLMVFRAVHDSLTGLTNRAGLHDFVDRLLVERKSESHAALFVDLDHFKDINDSLGHEAGDAILCEAARRLQHCVPAGAVVARQGGDEFVLVLAGVDESGARRVAARVVDELDRPFELRGEQHHFGASVGVALYPRHGGGRIELMRHADLAMYSAKQAGRGRHEVFDDRLEAAAHERLRIPRELRRDMDLGKLVAHFQARVSTIDGRVSSVEALVRWQHPERGLLFPDAFIALAEESSLIEDLGNWMIDEACGRMVGWRKLHPGLKRVSVNVSPRQLFTGQLPGFVRETLQRHGLAAEHLELEITESLLVEDAADVYAQLAELRALGVCIALDDFGTGFSSMAMLRKLPIDVMKIDRAFVKDLDTDDAAMAITRSIAALARSLNLHLVAEGIENETQAGLLRSVGCDEFQGYLYSKPIPPGEFSLLCTAREPKGTQHAAV